jgi:hypothetical protein
LLTALAAGFDTRHAPDAINGEAEAQVGVRQIGNGMLRPFDQADAVASKVFIQARIQIFFRLTESIKIKVIQV